jgi:hypothetical protein
LKKRSKDEKKNDTKNEKIESKRKVDASVPIFVTFLIGFTHELIWLHTLANGRVVVTNNMIPKKKRVTYLALQKQIVCKQDAHTSTQHHLNKCIFNTQNL